jgi:competence protein ComFC
MVLPIIAKTNWDFDLVIPVPISRRHQKERGFNQSVLIAKPIARSLKKDFTTLALQRIKDTSYQYQLTAVERHENVKDAFAGNPAKLNGRGVLLVDDIITTGATMENCTKALLTSGASRVYCISVARVIA